MKENNTRRGETQEVVSAVNQNNCHCRMLLSAISHIRFRMGNIVMLLKPANGQREDCRTMRAASLGMTSYLMSGSHPTYKGYSARSVTPQGRYAGYSGRIGFTLIELLVVVLIIGILAAVALPQYQKAVYKSRIATIKSMLKPIYEASKVCDLQKNVICNLDEIDVTLPPYEKIGWLGVQNAWAMPQRSPSLRMCGERGVQLLFGRGGATILGGFCYGPVNGTEMFACYEYDNDFDCAKFGGTEIESGIFRLN